MRLVLALVLIALGAVTANAAAADDPLSLIKAIYKTYTDIGPGEGGMPGLPHVYSKRLQALIDKDASETPEGTAGRIDWDVFVDGQDWQLTDLDIKEVSRGDAAAEVRATFKNFGAPRDMLFDLVRENGHWRIDEIEETLKPRWAMSKILSDAPDAFPDGIPGGDDDGEENGD
jgi:Protein of unknown function (DUF3828)